MPACAPALPLWPALVPPILMALALLLPALGARCPRHAWTAFAWLSSLSLLGTLAALALHARAGPLPAASAPQLPWLAVTRLGACLAVLVQALGSVVAAFSSRYLAGEPGQPRAVAALGSVLAAVHLLLLADHWLVLIAAWALVGAGLRPLLCFYAERPFALLAAHKKRLADRLADALLLAAAGLAWWQAGTGSLSGLWEQLPRSGGTVALQLSALCLALAVILRTALFPMHGWLIQVMEAPTPVSALLHAGVVNLGGYVLIRCAPLLEVAALARGVLVAFGLGTAVLASLVMLTRISIKVRLAWSTVAQMGFMVLECGLGLYTLAALHLAGHSLYKAQAFLSASSAVRKHRLTALQGRSQPEPAHLLAAPALAGVTVALVLGALPGPAWPWWWSALLAFAWAPLLWLPGRESSAAGTDAWCALAGVALVACLTGLAWLAHTLPLGLHDRPASTAGPVALAGMALLYLALATLQRHPHGLDTWQRRSYAGFYVDEFYTRLALRLWPTRWAPASRSTDLTTPA